MTESFIHAITTEGLETHSCQVLLSLTQRSTSSKTSPVSTQVDSCSQNQTSAPCIECNRLEVIQLCPELCLDLFSKLLGKVSSNSGTTFIFFLENFPRRTYIKGFIILYLYVRDLGLNFLKSYLTHFRILVFIYLTEGDPVTYARLRSRMKWSRVSWG